MELVSKLQDVVTSMSYMPDQHDGKYLWALERNLRRLCLLIHTVI